jgi:FKBP-type peptidyl-prolyl cis-trans isomerase
MNALKITLLLSLSYMTSGFLHTAYSLSSRCTLRNTALNMCVVNATDVLDRLKNLRGSRRDLLQGVAAGASAASLAILTSDKVYAKDDYDDSWTVHNGAFGEEFLSNFTKTSSGLLYKDITKGSGKTPNEGDAVTLHMVGYIYETGEKWTNTYKGIPSYQCVVRAGARPNQKFMKGLNEGVMGMKKGAKRILVIPAYLAYNYVTIYSEKDPSVTIIPPGAALVCYVETLSFKPLP